MFDSSDVHTDRAANPRELTNAVSTVLTNEPDSGARDLAILLCKMGHSTKTKKNLRQRAADKEPVKKQ